MKVQEEDYQIVKEPNIIDIGIIIQFVKHWWKSAVISDSQGKLLKIKDVNVSELFSQKEFVIYKNSQAVLAWEAEGYTTKNSKTALLVIVENDGIYFTFSQSKDSIYFISQIEMAILSNSNLNRMKSLEAMVA